MSLELSRREQAIMLSAGQSPSGLSVNALPFYTKRLGDISLYSPGDIGNIWRHFWLSQLGFLLVSSGWRLGMPLNTP